LSENLHHIDKIFRDSIEECNEMPSKHVWEAIDSHLDKSKINHISRRYKRLKRFAVLLSMLLLCTVIYNIALKHPGNRITRGNNDTITNKEVSENNSPVRQKAIPEKNKNNSPGKILIDKNSTETSGEMMNISNKKNAIGVLEVDKNKIKHQNPEQTKETAIGFNKGQSSKTRLNEKEEKDLIGELSVAYKKISKQAVNISVPAGETKNPSLKSLTTVQKDIMIPVNGTIEKGKRNHRMRSPFSVTIFFSPDFPFYRLQSDPPDNQSGNSIVKAEKPDLSTTTGILVNYKLNDHWVLQTGASYSNAIIQIDAKTIYAEKDNIGDIKYRYNASSGYGYVLPTFANSPNVGDSLYAFAATHTLRYLNIPVAAKYDLQKGKFIFFVSAGISTGILLQGIIETLVQDNSNNEIEVMNHLHGLKKIYFSGLVSIGAEYKLNDRFSVLLSPTRKFAINSINENAPVKSYPNSFGISAGIRLSF
jgi:hypothetical protein